jgi:pimeloyl-ACP methyl ester carboxylesterase
MGHLRLKAALEKSMQLRNSIKAIALSAGVICGLAVTGLVQAAELSGPGPGVTFSGGKTSWHGFDRYDFVLDTATGAITPYQSPGDEGNGVKDPLPGQRRCIVVVPKSAAPGNPWSWRGCYWDHQPQTEVELLNRGFCIAYISANATLKPDQEWDAWYAYLTAHGLSPKPAFIGMSRGGEYAYTWATRHPDKVACIYADNPGGNWEVMMHIAALATNDVPLLHVCGSFDPILGVFTLPIESMYQQFGGRISVMIKEGRGHHPHSLNDPKPIADFIEHSVAESKIPAPDFVGERFTKTWYYSSVGDYREFPSEHTYITLRGPLFTPCYARYRFELPNVEASTTIIAPTMPAPGKPWVFRADLVGRDNAVDQELLARGFYIVTGAVPYNADGPVLAQWNTIYEHLVAHGFSRKPVMEGSGGAAGEAYAWAIANADKVSCIYAENPILHSNTTKTQPLDDLGSLAKAGVPLLHVCGSLDPWLQDNTRIAEKRYQQLGGTIKVIIHEGEGHYPPAGHDPKPAVDFITQATR